MYENINDDLTKITFETEDLFENLSENDKKNFLSNCSLIFNNPFFKKICDEMGTQAILYSVKETRTLDELSYGRGKIHGIATIYEELMKYDSLYQETIRKEESFDKHATI
jgi:hypothetical protein